MKNITLLTAIILSCSTFAISLDCNDYTQNTSHDSLEWAEVVLEFTGGANFKSVMCLGFDRTKELRRVHYFNEDGYPILKSAAYFAGESRVFFERKMVPWLIRQALRNEEPLVAKLAKTHNAHEYIFNLGFVDNMLRGGSWSRRSIPVTIDHHYAVPQISYKEQQFNKVVVLVSGWGKIRTITFSENGKNGKSFDAHSFQVMN